MCHLPGGRVRILTVNRNIVDIALVVFHKLGRLHKHSARTAGRIVNPAVVRFQDLDQCFHHTGRREKFTAFFAFLFGKHGKTVFVSATQNVAGVAMIFHFNIGKKIHHIPQTALIQLRTGKVFRKDAFQPDIFLFNQNHCVINGFANLRSMSRFCDLCPASFCRNKKDIA